MGAKVLAIDPAELEPALLENKNLTHIRRRGHEVKKRDYRDVAWLIADLNMAPTYTLDTVADIVKHESVDVKGVVLTLKLTDWQQVDDIPSWMKRVKEMGFQVVKSKQLAFNRRECVLIGVKDKFLLRSRKRKTKKVASKGSNRKGSSKRATSKKLVGKKSTNGGSQGAKESQGAKSQGAKKDSPS